MVTKYPQKYSAPQKQVNNPKLNSQLVPKDLILKLVAEYGYSETYLETVKKQVAKDLNFYEFAFFLSVAKRYDLDPLLKQVWAYKDSKDNVICFAGRDGFMTIAQRGDRWGGIQSVVVYSNDDFEMEMNGNTPIIKHKIKTFNPKDRGEILGAYCIVTPKGSIPTVEIAEFKQYNRATTPPKYQNTWNTHPDEMIKKVAEIHAMKRAFGISGIYGEEEMNIERGVVIDVPQEMDTSNIDLHSEALKVFEGNIEEIDKYMLSIQDKVSANEYNELMVQAAKAKKVKILEVQVELKDEISAEKLFPNTKDHDGNGHDTTVEGA